MKKALVIGLIILIVLIVVALIGIGAMKRKRVQAGEGLREQAAVAAAAGNQAEASRLTTQAYALQNTRETFKGDRKDCKQFAKTACGGKGLLGKKKKCYKAQYASCTKQRQQYGSPNVI